MEDNCKYIEQEVVDNRQRTFTTWGIALGLTTHPETSARYEILHRSSESHRFCLFSIHSHHSTQFSPYDFLTPGFQIEKLCFVFLYLLSPFKSNEIPAWCNTVQVLFLQGLSTCFGRKRPSSGVFKTSTAATGTCVIVAGQSSHLLIRAGTHLTYTMIHGSTKLKFSQFSHRQPSLVRRRQASGLWSVYRFIACSFISAVWVVSDHDRILDSPVASVWLIPKQHR